MKNIYKYSLFLMVLMLVSCTQNELTEFDVHNGQTIVGFKGSQELMFYDIDDPETYFKEIVIGVNTLSDQVRTVSVSASDESTAPINMYTLTQSVSINVDEFDGKLIVTGVAENMDATGKYVIIKIDGIDQDGAIISEDTFKVILVRIN